MHVEATGTAIFTDQATGKTIRVEAKDLDWDCESDGERQMGAELVHSADYDVAGKTVTWSLWEYPVGVQNHEDTYVPEGLTLVQDIEYGLVHDPED